MLQATHVVVFDVEAVGLHGVGFAFGACIVDLRACAIVDERCAQTDAHASMGTKQGFAWISTNVLPALRKMPGHKCQTPTDVRALFWDGVWENARVRYGDKVLLAADCAWPVEARFLAACVDDNFSALQSEENPRYWRGPYPLIDIATLLAAVPEKPPERAADELPEHHPLMDARHSARQMLWALERLERSA